MRQLIRVERLDWPSGPFRGCGANMLQLSFAQTIGIALAAERCIDHVYRHHSTSCVGLQLKGLGRKRTQRFILGLSRKAKIVG